VLISDLVPFAINAVNGPGGTMFSTDTDEWAVSIANAFWYARLRGFFQHFAVDAANTEITHLTDTNIEFDRADAQLVVRFAVINAIEAKILSLPTGKRVKAGPVESETQRAASVLVELLKQNRKELEEIRDQIIGQTPMLAGFVDLVLVRQEQALSGVPSWVN
jgi:hypothetical protein